ncbi:solute carrier family 35 member e4 [Anaeramoeba flamelloides]|uniref:Solute carrier family 35 member e4 n=1 Tax=Anaeramoeba flamelloides TaxID=1746091 RepID=A0AAV7YKB8_9EUKA|nr:solute carrier family 35 member e4 [Anaeramoeba flamelloides]
MIYFFIENKKKKKSNKKADDQEYLKQKKNDDYQGKSRKKQHSETKNKKLHFFLMSFLFSANIYLGNLSIQYCSVSLIQIIRSMIPGITAILTRVMLNKRYSARLYVSVVIVIIGVAIATYGEINGSKFGIFITFLACFVSSLKSIMCSVFLKGENKSSPIQLLSTMAPQASVIMFLGILTSKESFKEALSALDFNICVFIIVSAMIAFFLNFANFNANKETSALTINIAGNIKHLCTIIISVVLFKNPFSKLNVVGAILATAGTIWYTSILNSKKKI